MRSISQGLGIEKVYTLDSASPSSDKDPKQSTTKQTPQIIRIPRTELEYAYIKSPIVFNSINKLTQSIMSAGWELRSTDDKALEFFKDFLANIGTVGGDITFNELLENLFQYQMIYGSAYIETVLGANTTDPNNIVDLVLLDPKRMDYAKKSDQTIALTEYGNPVGYTQSVPYRTDPTIHGDPIPEGIDITLQNNEIFLIEPRIVQFDLYTIGDMFYGFGLIEPAYSSILSELTIKRVSNDAVEQKADAPIIDYVGDQFHEPTPQQITNALDNLKKMKSNRFLAFPHWHRVEPLNVKSNDAVKDTLTYLRQDMSASLGMPLAFATGAGEATNRATLATQHTFLTLTLNDIVNKTLAVLHKFVFRRLAESNNFADVPRIVWGNLGVEEINEKAERLRKYAKEGLLSPEETKDYILQSERLKDPQEGDKAVDIDRINPQANKGAEKEEGPGQ